MMKRANHILMAFFFGMAACMITENACAQVLFGLNGSVYSGNLGEATYPGFGMHVGYQAKIAKRLDVQYNVSFIRNVGKYENVPRTVLRDYYNTITIEDLYYLNNLSINLTNFGFDGLIKVYRGERSTFDLDLGMGLFILNQRYASALPYSKELPVESHRALGFGFGMGMGWQFIINDGYSFRLATTLLSTTSRFNGNGIAMFGLSSAIILNSGNSSDDE